MKLIRKAHEFPVSLHDGHIEGWLVEGETLTVTFSQLYGVSEKAELQYKGQVIFHQLDLAECRVWVFEGAPFSGPFSGQVDDLATFIDKFSGVDLEIISETYKGYETIWQGYLYPSEAAPVMVWLRFFALGEVVFDLEVVKVWPSG